MNTIVVYILLTFNNQQTPVGVEYYPREFATLSNCEDVKKQIEQISLKSNPWLKADCLKSRVLRKRTDE